MGNYIMINGNKIELMDYQVKLIQDSQIVKNDEIKNCFDRVKSGELYYYIDENGNVDWGEEDSDKIDDGLYSVGNYCTNEKIMQQRAWHEILSRRLWRFSMMNDGDKIDWKEYNIDKYYIYFKGLFYVGLSNYNKDLEPYFYSEEIAQRAIDKIVIPFMDEHPDFIW